MMLWAALSCLLALQESSPAGDEAALRKENAELKERLAQLEAAALEDARHIHRLRQLVKVLQEQAAALESVSKGVPAGPSGPAAKPPVETGPDKPIKGKVAYVDAKNGFVTLGIGKKDGVQVGFKFEIYRETLEPGGETRLTRVALGEVEKFMGQDSMSKVIVKEGMAADIRVDDVAVAIRKLAPVAPAAPGDTAAPFPAPPAPADPANGLFSITGVAGQGFILNYGGVHGARQTDLVFVQGGPGQIKAKLRIDRVDKNFCVAGVVDGTQVVPPAVGDTVSVREPRKVLSGKVALCDDKQGKVAVDLRQRDGIKAGQKLEARRQGQRVGLLVVTEVQTWGSWAQPSGESKIEDFKKGDFVEALDP